jgi:outer membrane protein assembly factor BamE (lipoprotein component of BamABCDE complex)
LPEDERRQRAVKERRFHWICIKKIANIDFSFLRFIKHLNSMKSNVFIIAIVFLSGIFLLSGCPSSTPPQNAEVNQNAQANQNTRINQNTEVNSVNQANQNNSNNAGNRTLSLNNIPLPPNANVRSNTSSTQTEPKETNNQAARLTLENYGKIKVGMSYEEVVAILGKETEILSEDIPVAGQKSGLYKWSAKSGEVNISALFQNGKVLTKNQFGLK